MIFDWSDQFRKSYKVISPPIRKKIHKALLLFERNPRHPSLHVEKIDLSRNIWSARVDINYRFTFQWISNGIYLRNVGAHQKTYRSP